MSTFERQQRRFACLGVKLTGEKDNLPPGKYAILQNVRAPRPDQIQARDGLNAIANIGSAIHSVIQMDDPTPFAGKSVVQMIGAGASVYQGAVNGPYPQADTGYSGDPLFMDPVTPPNSAQPWMVAADRSRMRKINSSGTVYGIGLAPPLNPPSSKLGQLGFNILENYTSLGQTWQPVGSQIGVITQINRSNSGIQTIIYDDGAAPSYASIVPSIWDNFGVGELVTINGKEIVPVTEVTVAVATTTIASIIYDAGSTGLCTIQPVASLGTGQLQAPDYQGYLDARTSATPPPPPPDFVSRGFPINTERIFPVNALVTLGGSETVRILSVAVGPDQVQSFRCSTAGTHVAGEGIVGVAAFRGYVTGTYVGAESLITRALSSVITPIALTATATPTATAGIRTPGGWAPRDLSLINGRATQPDDDVHLSGRFNLCPEIQTVRVYFSLEPTAGSAPNNTTDFTANYYFYEWRASDLASAIQSQNAAPVGSIQGARATFVTNWIENQPLPFGGSIEKGGTSINQNPDTTSSSVAIGNSQWLELRCKVRDLIRVGTDTSKTLANVTAAEILVSISGAAAVQADFDALWLSGGFGPDQSTTGAPILYWYRYRSTITGAISNPSPPTRAGVIPHRQAVFLSGVASADAQCDVVDWFRMGAALTHGTYVGTQPNVAPLNFTDAYTDSAISNNETITFDKFQPWTMEDKSYSGTCKVAGNAIQWVSGDQFRTSWAPGSQIIVANEVYTLYSQPPSATLLFIHENAGSGGAVAFQIRNPIRIGQTFATWWGGALGGTTVYFSCGDTLNPGVLHWTTPNNMEVTSDGNVIEVTDAAEPLQNGFLYDGTAYVSSTDQIYVLEPTSDPNSPFRPLITPCGRGFWTRWCFAVAPEGVYFLARDGIYFTSGGGLAQPLTDEDLYPLFPHDGVPGFSVNGYIPPDMTQTTKLRLSSIDEWLYFDYLGTDGKYYTLAYYKPLRAWFPDRYGDGSTGAGPTCRWGAIGLQEHTELIGGSDGQVYTPQVGKITDGSQAFLCRVQHAENQGDARREKIYRDYMLDGTLFGNVKVTLGLTNNATLLAAVTPTDLVGRGEYFVNVLPPIGGFGLNLTALIEWNPVVAGITVLNLWDIAYQLAPELATSWLSGPTTHGFKGFQSVYQVLLAYRANGACTLTLLVDNVTYAYAVPSSNGQFSKIQVLLQAVKGLQFQYGLQTVDPTTGCMVWINESESWVTQWGSGGYRVVRPMGA